MEETHKPATEAISDLKRVALLEDKLKQEIQEDYPFQSRVHALSSFGPSTFVKRDDELGFGISGNKIRKYRTLVPFLSSYKEIVILGGPYSNHVLGLTQLLIEKGIAVTLFLKGRYEAQAKGNFFFLKKLRCANEIHWIESKEWVHAEKMASEYAQNKDCCFVLKEGAPLFSCFLGALTLPLDILRNEKEKKLHFDHLWMDLGTGFSAAALLLAFAFLKKTTFCHLVLMAGTENEFFETLKELHSQFEKWLGKTCPFPTQFSVEAPLLSPSFGSTNATVFNFVEKIAKTEGFFLDPIYSAKLFYQAKQHQLSGATLILHSGGALTLSGFQR